MNGNTNCPDDLIAAIREGSEAAFRQLYDQFHAALYRNAFRLLKDEQATEDVVQETFIRLWEKRRELDPERSAAGWLFTVNYHLSVNRLRLQLHVELNDVLVDTIADEPVLMSDIEAQWRILEEAVYQLPTRQRQVFELCKLRGKTYDKTAHELGISKYTVAEYLQQAIANIRQYIHRHPIEKAFLVFLSSELLKK